MQLCMQRLYAQPSNEICRTSETSNPTLIQHQHGRPQVWARGGYSPPPGKVVKCFDALVMTVKCSAGQLFMHYFQNIRRLLEASPPDPIRTSFMEPAGGRKPQAP